MKNITAICCILSLITLTYTLILDHQGICQTGLIPVNCDTNSDKISLLCYRKCPAGYMRFGVDCHQNCPTTGNWSDDGLFCTQNSYVRNGYPFKFGEFSSSGAVTRCETDNGKGNC